ncbi:hypothetical protein M5689_005536 [Euphorbia peplus]|nr:hypothetical protein M5689_005536 [Euphorbia peplus]
MDVKSNHVWNGIEDEGSYAEALGISDSYREPELLPRIGDKFQVEIPPLLSKSAYLSLTEGRNNQPLSPGASHDFLVGLPISLMWIKEKAENIKHEPQEFRSHSNSFSNTNGTIKSESTNRIQLFRENGVQVKAEPLDTKLCNGIEAEEMAKLDLLQGEKDRMHLQDCSKWYCLVPGSFDGMWSDVQEASFLLGLYIFGKNFVLVNKFVETRRMGELLSFYYGRFYRSEKYQRWSSCRKIRSRKCIYGQRMFSGYTQQELLSRLSLHASEDCKNSLTEVAKTYGEGKVSLEEYVFALKSMVGLNTLIEAVGIGTGKQDLTGMALEHLKPNQGAPVRPEMPAGKACSSLSPLEIVNFLTGGFRLSKARSNDLFWEAVWPRLLARGWHSEQPRDHGFIAASRHSLVFLIPGVKKFSRRKLVKGNHYFDSVSDVLNKVASDPALLELDVGVDKGCENGWTDEKALDRGEFSDQQRHCYLKPRTPSRSGEKLKFTVVDTSRANGEETKVRELRSLPVEIMDISTFQIDSDESDEDSSDDTENESDASVDTCVDQNKTDTSKFMKINVDEEDSSDKNSVDNNALKQSPTVIVSGFKVLEELTKEPKTRKCSDIQPDIPNKDHLAKKTKTKDRKLSAPVVKRRRKLTECESAATRCSTISASAHERLKQDEASCTAANPDLRMNFSSDTEPHQTKLLSASSSSNPSNTDGCTFSSNYTVNEHQNEKPQPRTLIDLNIPVPQDIENESFITETNGRMDDEGNGSVEDSGMLKTSSSSCHPTSEQPPPSMNGRRQSTRNRPLTTKALEALACGFLSIRPKKHRRDDFPLDKSITRPSRRARNMMRLPDDNFGAGPDGVIDFQGDDRASTTCKGNGDMLSEVQV